MISNFTHYKTDLGYIVGFTELLSEILDGWKIDYVIIFEIMVFV